MELNKRKKNLLVTFVEHCQKCKNPKKNYDHFHQAHLKSRQNITLTVNFKIIYSLIFFSMHGNIFVTYVGRRLRLPLTLHFDKIYFKLKTTLLSHI